MAHVIEYTLFGILLARALRTCLSSLLPIALSVFLITVLYGILDEYHQMSVPTRMAEVSDVIADSIGALTALLLYPINTRRPSSTSSS